MKKSLFLLLAVIVFGAVLVSAPLAVDAVDLGQILANKTATKSGFSGTTSDTTLAETIGTIIQTLLSFVGVIFLVLMVYAGFLWMTARGEEGQVDKAKDIITTSVIGLTVTLSAYAITAFVVPRIIERSLGSAGGDATLGIPQ